MKSSVASMMVRAMTSTAYRRVASLGSAGSFLLVLRLLGALVPDEETVLTLSQERGGSSLGLM